MDILFGIFFGVIFWFFARYGIGGFYTVGPNQRAVLCTFGRAQRLGMGTTLRDPISQSLTEEERQSYEYPLLQVIQPGMHWKLPWEGNRSKAHLLNRGSSWSWRE